MRYFFLMLLIYNISCSSIKSNNKSKEKIETDSKYLQKFILKIPDNWKTIKSHGYNNFSPLNENENFHHTKVYIIGSQPNKTESFIDYITTSIQRTKETRNISSEKLTEANNRFGQVYKYVYESNFMGVLFKTRTMYFQFNGEFYVYNFSSTLDNYDKYLSEANSIFESVLFK